jgi:hypothetical protein
MNTIEFGWLTKYFKTEIDIEYVSIALLSTIKTSLNEIIYVELVAVI